MVGRYWGARAASKYPHCTKYSFSGFSKTFFKGKHFAVWRVSERGKFDFYHYFAFLTNFLKR